MPSPKSDVRPEHAAHAEDEYRSLLDCVPAFIWYKDAANNILRCSGLVAEALGRRIEAVEGHSIRDFYPDEADRYFADDLEVLRTGRPKRRIIEPLQTATGKKIWIRTDKTPYRDATGAIMGVVVAAVQISDDADSDGAQLIAELEREKRLAVARDELLSLTAHELRTPLTPLSLKIQMIEHLLDAAAGGMRAEEPVRRVVHSLSGHVESMARRIDDLLDAARLSQGRLTLRRNEVDLGRLVRDVFERFSEAIARGGSTTSLFEEVPVMGFWDQARLEQVVVNLLTNAMKYGASRPIVVRLRRTETTALLSVRDAGMGIPREDQDRIFGKFERTASARPFKGLGLGLFIARQIVDAHGGRIFVESDVGQGAEFFVELPLGAP